MIGVFEFMSLLEWIVTVVVGVGVLAALRMVYLDSYDFFDGIAGTVGALVFGFVVWLAGIMGTAGIANLFMDHTDFYESSQILALQDSTVAGGSFFLGIGTIDGKPTYTFYEASGGSRELVAVEAAGVKVFEDASEPYLVRFAGCELSAPWFASCLSDRGEINEIHVPPGTIRTGYELDAK